MTSRITIVRSLLHEETDGGDVLEAYERLVYDAMVGDRTPFSSATGIERLWQVSGALLDDPSPVERYPVRSWDPSPSTS